MDAICRTIAKIYDILKDHLLRIVSLENEVKVLRRRIDELERIVYDK